MKQKQFREACGLTQVEFAKRIGVHPITVCRYEIGQRFPSVSTKKRIFAAFGVVLDYDEFGANASRVDAALPKPRNSHGKRGPGDGASIAGTDIDSDTEQPASVLIELNNGLSE